MSSKHGSKSSRRRKASAKGRLRYIVIGALVLGGTEFMGEIISLTLFGISWLPVETVDDYLEHWLWVPLILACIGALIGFKLGPKLWQAIAPAWDDFI